MNREHAPVPKQPPTADGALCGSLAQVSAFLCPGEVAALPTQLVFLPRIYQ